MDRSVKHRILVEALVSTTLAMGAVPAAAQTTQTTENVRQTAAEPATSTDATTSADQAATVNQNEIIVTARRRNETLQTTPVAITAVNAAILEDKAATNIGALQGEAPNLLITQQNSGAQAANLSIRGLTYADIEKSQTPTVGVVVDGVAAGTNTGQLSDLFDIEQIEVLRGPQGTLFGANTIGGVINIRRSRPTMKFGVKAEATYGSYNSFQGRFVGNIGDGDTIGLKAWYFHDQSDGFYRNGVTGKRAGGNSNNSFGAAALFTPQGTGFDALLTVEKTHQRFDPVNSNIARTGELFCVFEPANQCNRNTRDDLYTVFNSPATSRYSAPAVTLEMNYAAGPVKLTSITGYRESNEFQTQDFDASSTDLYYTLRRQNYHQVSQELRAAGGIVSGLDYVVGGYYFESKYDLIQYTRLFAFNTAVSPTTADPNPQSVTGNTTSYAGFVDFNWAFADKFRLSFGGRYTHDNKKLSNRFAQSGLIGVGDAGFSKFTPKVGVDYRPSQDAMIYASWSRGYRSGGFSARASTAATASTPFQPETVDSYEVGTKLDLFDRTVQLNFAGFISKYNNLQQNTTIPGGPTGNQTITGNVGSATIKGIEFDGGWRISSAFRISATAAYLDSHFKNFIAGNSIGNVLPTFVGTTPAGAAAVLALPTSDPRQAAYLATPTNLDYSNNNLIYSPKFTASANANYTVPTSFGKIVATAGIRHISRYDQQISLGPITGTLPNATLTANGVTVTQPASPLVVNGNDPRVRTAVQNLVDATLTVDFKIRGADVYARVFGRNLANVHTTSAAFTVAGLWSFASAIEPRVFGGTIGTKF